MVQTIAQILGWKPTRRPTEPTIGDIAAEAARFGVPLLNGADLGTPAPIIDLDEMREKNRARALEIARRNAAAQNSG